MIVIDTSVAIKWAFAEPGHREALELLDLDEPRFAPDLLLPELAYVLRKKCLRGEATGVQTRAALANVTTCIERFIASTEIASAALVLSAKLDHSAYDCFFLAVALSGGALVTADQVFAKKCRDSGYGAFVFQLGEPTATLLAAMAEMDRNPALAADARRLLLL